MDNDSKSPEISNGSRLLQRFFIVIIFIAFVLQFAQVIEVARYGLGEHFIIEFLVISLLPAVFFLSSYVLQSRQQTRLTRLFRATAAATAAWFFWTALGQVLNRFLTKSPTHMINVYIYLAVAVFFVMSGIGLYFRTNKIW